MVLDRQECLEIMESDRVARWPWVRWQPGFFPFEVKGVRSGEKDIDGSTPQQRAEDLAKTLPGLPALNKFLKNLFPQDPKVRAEAVTTEEAVCKNCGGSLVVITYPNALDETYLTCLYSPDCGRGGQIPAFST